MENVKLNFAHLCDMAFLSKEGKVNIIGIFKTIFSQNFPAIHPKFSVVISFLISKGSQGNHGIKIRMVKKDENKSNMPDLNFNFEVSESAINQDGEMNFIFDAAGINFESPGEYEIIIILDDKEIKKIPFAVTKINIKN